MEIRKVRAEVRIDVLGGTVLSCKRSVQDLFLFIFF